MRLAILLALLLAITVLCGMPVHYRLTFLQTQVVDSFVFVLRHLICPSNSWTHDCSSAPCFLR